MGLLTNSGSVNSTSLPAINPQVITPTDNQQIVEDRLASKDYVRDTYHNNTALTKGRDDEIINALKGFAQGTPIKVVWFHNIDNRTDSQTSASTLSFLSSSVNQSFLRINDFELRLTGPMVFSYNQDQTKSTYSGEGVVFPGFSPKQGDIFLYEVENGKLGLFKISNAPERLSIRSETSHKVTFVLYDFVGEAELAALTERVRDVAYFDKQRFLLEEGALLTSDDVVDLKFARDKHAELTKFYYNTFYDKRSYHSVVSPSGVYDPYLVEFLKATISRSDSGRDLSQMLHDRPHDGFSIWDKLLQPDRVSWDALATHYVKAPHKTNALDTQINGLLNREFIRLTKNNEFMDEPPVGSDIVDIEYYATYSQTMEELGNELVVYISDNLGSGNVLTPLEELITFYAEYQVVKINTLVTMCENIYQMPKEEQFYAIPVILFLMKIIEHGITTGTKIKIVDPNTLPYVEIAFNDTSANFVNNVLTIDGGNIKVVSLLDNNRNVLFLEQNDITTTTTDIAINLTDIMAEQNVTSIPDDWYLVILNNNLVIR